MTAPFSILGIDRVVLRAADPAGLERFYIDVLGCKLELRQGKLTQLRAGLALITIEADRAAYDATVARLAAAGVETTPADGGCQAADPWGTRIALVAGG